jgi:tetratricopeptide (TPR) repeat protein
VEDVQSLDLQIKFKNAQNLMQAGRYIEAKVLFEDVAKEDPAYPEVAYYLGLANGKVEIEKKYQEAVDLQNQQDITGALVKYQEIADVDSNYKDVSLQIEALNTRSDLLDNLKQGDTAFENEDWEDAVTHYENLRALNPEFQTPYIEDRLVQSYMNAAEALLAQQDKPLSVLERADEYFRRALTIRPRDSEILARRSKVRDALEEGMFWGYVEEARLVLSDSPDSLDAMRQAKAYFDLALGIFPENEQIRLERELVDTYMSSKDAFDAGNYDDAVMLMEYVTQADPGYANGTARQILYESYLARGDEESAGGYNDVAVRDYQRAAELAEEDPDSVLRLYEAQIKLAGAHGILGNYQQADQLYRSAVELSSFREQAAEKEPQLINKLDQADQLYDVQNYRGAFRLYTEVTTESSDIYEIQYHIVAQGEYLSLLANQYGSTVSAIAQMNNIKNPNRIYVGQQLMIPVLVKTGENTTSPF